MKKIIVASCFLIFSYTHSFSQLAVNPQVGLTLASLHNLEANVTSKPLSSFQAGIDFRIGKKGYFQPGAFFSDIKTEYSVADSNFSVHFARASVKLKALLGVNLISKSLMKVRLNAGPSFDVVVDKSVSGGAIDESIRTQVEKEFKAATFNIDAGAGVDLSFLTAEISYSFGLSEALKNHTAKYGTFFLTVGIVFGSTD